MKINPVCMTYKYKRQGEVKIAKDKGEKKENADIVWLEIRNIR